MSVVVFIIFRLVVLYSFCDSSAHAQYREDDYSACYEERTANTEHNVIAPSGIKYPSYNQKENVCFVVDSEIINLLDSIVLLFAFADSPLKPQSFRHLDGCWFKLNTVLYNRLISQTSKKRLLHGFTSIVGTKSPANSSYHMNVS